MHHQDLEESVDEHFGNLLTSRKILDEHFIFVSKMCAVK
jgi:hypothetical protein